MVGKCGTEDKWNSTTQQPSVNQQHNLTQVAMLEGQGGNINSVSGDVTKIKNKEFSTIFYNIGTV